MGTYENGRAFAQHKDSLDPIAHLRDHFYTKENQIYMDGNSLGLCSKDAEKAVPTAKALLKGGINAMEITFRTAAAKDSIAKVAAEVPTVMPSSRAHRTAS